MDSTVEKVDEAIHRERTSRLAVLVGAVVVIFALVGMIAGGVTARVTRGDVTAPVERVLEYQVALSEREQCGAQIEAQWEIAIDAVIYALATGAIGDVAAAVQASRTASEQLAAVNELCPPPEAP